MKKAPFFLSILAFAACSKTEVKEEVKNNNIVLAEDVQTILPMESDTSLSWSCADFTNAFSKLDEEKMFSFISKGVLTGKFKAYLDYPNKELSAQQVDKMLVSWDSTATAEDPNHPGVMISAPMKFEISYWNVPHINFHETIEMDTVTNTLYTKIAYASVYIFNQDEKGEILGTKKLFDVKFDKEKK